MDLAYLKSHWAQVRARLLETLNKFSEADLDFRPFPASWTVRQLLLHIAQEERGEFNYGIVQTLKEFPLEYPTQEYPSVAAIQALLTSVHTPTLAYLETLNDDALNRMITTPWGATYRLVEMFGHLIEHEIHHRAELSLILGMLGREGLNA